MSVADVAEWIVEANSVVAFTGAGISTESGIPDFRSPNGVWAKNRQIEFDEYLNSAEAREEYWRQKSEAHQGFIRAQPNVGHRILADWEQRGKLLGVITQNIDGLHQQAGNGNVLELHGTARDIACLSCNHRTDADPLVQQFLIDQVVPVCPDCGGLIKHATVSFGQMLPQDVFANAVDLAGQTDLLIVLGSSLVVYPAAGIPEIAKRSGARLVIINREETSLDRDADAVFHQPIGETLLEIQNRLTALRKNPD